MVNIERYKVVFRNIVHVLIYRILIPSLIVTAFIYLMIYFVPILPISFEQNMFYGFIRVAGALSIFQMGFYMWKDVLMDFIKEGFKGKVIMIMILIVLILRVLYQEKLRGR